MWKKVIILSLMLEQIDKNLISFILTKDSQHVSQTRKATLIQKKKKTQTKNQKTNKQTNKLQMAFKIQLPRYLHS
jgi:hypothetical protein